MLAVYVLDVLPGKSNEHRRADPTGPLGPLDASRGSGSPSWRCWRSRTRTSSTSRSLRSPSACPTSRRRTKAAGYRAAARHASDRQVRLLTDNADGRRGHSEGRAAAAAAEPATPWTCRGAPRFDWLRAGWRTFGPTRRRAFSTAFVVFAGVGLRRLGHVPVRGRLLLLPRAQRLHGARAADRRRPLREEPAAGDRASA